MARPDLPPHRGLRLARERGGWVRKARAHEREREGEGGRGREGGRERERVD